MKLKLHQFSLLYEAALRKHLKQRLGGSVPAANTAVAPTLSAAWTTIDARASGANGRTASNEIESGLAGSESIAVKVRWIGARSRNCLRL